MIDADVKNDVLNECLAALGQAPLSSFDKPVDYIEKWAVNRLNNGIDEILQLRPWTGALQEKILSQLAENSLSGAPRYQLPQDCVRVNFVRGLTENDWRQMGNVLIIGRACRKSNVYAAQAVSSLGAGTPQICYNDRTPKVTWGANLRTLIGLRLALKIQKPNENSAAARERMNSEYFTQMRITSAVEGASQSGYVWREDMI